MTEGVRKGEGRKKYRTWWWCVVMYSRLEWRLVFRWWRSGLVIGSSSELVAASNVKVGWELEIRNLQFERPPIYVITSPPFQPTMKLTEIISKNE